MSNETSLDETSSVDSARRDARLQVVYQRAGTRAEEEAALVARWTKAGEKPMRFALAAETLCSHFTLHTLFEDQPDLDLLIHSLWRNGYRTVEDLNGASVKDVFERTDAPLHQMRRVVDTLIDTISELKVSL